RGNAHLFQEFAHGHIEALLVHLSASSILPTVISSKSSHILGMKAGLLETNVQSEVKAQAPHGEASNRGKAPEPGRGLASRPPLPETRGQDGESVQPEA
ncbi:MAG TPA: hypothetical protein VIG52_11000, partial [Methyloceanibacter sp.]